MMELTNSVLFTLLMLALLLISWLLGYFSRNKSMPGRKFIPDPDYFVGLNFLLNDEPDDAIDVFIYALEINSGTFETHLALSTLLRRRGKVDRSIEHCATLLASGSFKSRQLSEIRIQMVRSYIAAGLLDRAEELLIVLKQSPTSIKLEALGLVVMVYQIEKEWSPAIAAATELLNLTTSKQKPGLHMQVSHFHCELAEAALNQHLYEQARDELKKAGRQYKNNIRVYILGARVEFLQGNFQEAVTHLQKALQIDATFFSEIFSELEAYTLHADMTERFQAVMELNHELFSDSSYLKEMALYREKNEGAAVALGFLLEKLKQNPSLHLLQQAMQMAFRNHTMENTVLHNGTEVLALFFSNSPNYRCENCGFELKNLHWACPGCNRWGVVLPIDNQIPHLNEQGTTSQ